jgi:gliding motility-associated-like protein
MKQLLTIHLFACFFIWLSNSPVVAQTNIFAQLTGSTTVNTSGWILNGAADIGDTGGDIDLSSNEIVLTDAVAWTSGGIFYSQPLDLSLCNQWIVEFDFRIWGGTAADGIAFCFLDTPPSGFVSGQGVGIPSSVNGIFVIFDTWDNGCGVNPELQLYEGGNYSECNPNMISRVTNLGLLRSDNYQTCRIQYNAGVMNISINGTMYASGTITSSLSGYLGFTAGTGAAMDQHSIRNVKIYADIAVGNAGDDLTICSGQVAQIGDVPNPLYSYNWSTLNGQPSNQHLSNPQIMLENNTDAPISYTFTLETNFSNLATSCPFKDQVIVTVNPKPAVFAGEDFQTCEGENITFSASGAGNYLWSNGISNGIPFQLQNSGNYSFVVTGNNQYVCSSSDTINIEVKELPIATIFAAQTSGCAPLISSLSHDVTNSISSTWEIQDDLHMVQGNGSYTHTFTQGGCYDILLTVADSNGCVNSTFENDFICVTDQPTADFQLSTSQLTEFDADISFINTSLNAESFVWYFGDSVGFSYEASPYYSYEDAGVGTYEVKLIAISGSECKDTAVKYVTVSEDLIFYIPNTFTPDGDEFNQTFLPVFTTGFEPDDFNMKIFNRWGQTVFETNDVTIGWDGSYGNISRVDQVQEGLYSWIMEFKLSQNDGHKMVTGHVIVIR